MKSKEPFDYIIHRKAQKHTAPVPDDMWDRIEAQLPQKRKKNSRYLLLMLMLLGLTGLVGLYLAAENDEPMAAHTAPKVEQSIAKSTIQADELLLASKQEDNTKVESESLPISESTTESIAQNTSSSQVSSLSIEKDNDNIDEQNAEAVEESEEELLAKQRSRRANRLKANGYTSLNQLAVRSAIYEVDDLPLVEANAVASSQQRNWDGPWAEFRQECPSFVDDPTGVYFDAYVSHDYAHRTLTTSNTELANHVDMRNSTESATYSYSAGLRLTMLLPNGAGLKTGLNYSNIQERFVYDEPDSEMTRLVITIDTINNMEVRDTSVVVVSGARSIEKTNSYTTLDIPLLLTYEWDIRKRMYMSVNAGAYLNILFKNSGKIVGHDLNPVLLEESGGNFFEDNLGVRLYASTGLHYRLNKHIDLVLEPNVTMMLKSATVAPVNQKWLTVGLATGARFHF